MWLLDITTLFNQGRVNEYTFNPSICWLEKNLFFISYRTILYDVAFSIHPWGAWFGYKVFKNPSVTAAAKYRDGLGPQIVHILPQKTFAQIVKDGENDTTSLALVEWKENKFHVIWNIGQLFPNEYNQDARLMKLKDGTIVCIYNVFSQNGVTLRTRTLQILQNTLHMSPEEYLFDHKYRKVEKHCTYEETRDKIHYSLGETFSQIDNGLMMKNNCTIFHSLYAKYGSENIFISLATPSVPFTQTTKIACGHVKMLYKKLGDKIRLLQHIDPSLIKPHGKYLYFAFFYEFKNGDILRMSPLFIPTVNNSHVPYLLFMAIGLTKFDDKYILSAGEGDVRCKLLFLTHKEIEMSLETKEKDPCFLTESMHIHHVGYYGNKWNCGDDAFEIVFRHWEANSPHTSSFSTQFECDENKTSIYILGGGDVVNNYFLPHHCVPQKNAIAISVGVPYQEFGPLLDPFQRVFLRNSADVHVYPNTEFLPDITFLLKQIWGTVTPKNRIPKSVGIILTRTYYNPNYTQLYEDFVKEFGLFCDLLLRAGFHIVFIPFGINENKPQENDLLMIDDIIAQLNVNKNYEVFHVQNRNDYVWETYFKIGQMSFNICTRFHSHIFSMIHHIPFISLTCGRKCIELMRTSMPECLFRLKSNQVDLPIQFDGNLFFHFFESKYQERQSIQSKLQIMVKPWIKQLMQFPYLSILRQYATNVKTIFWLPPKHTTVDDSSSPPWRLDHGSSSSPPIYSTSYPHNRQNVLPFLPNTNQDQTALPISPQISPHISPPISPPSHISPPQISPHISPPHISPILPTLQPMLQYPQVIQPVMHSYIPQPILQYQSIANFSQHCYVPQPILPYQSIINLPQTMQQIMPHPHQYQPQQQIIPQYQPQTTTKIIPQYQPQTTLQNIPEYQSAIPTNIAQVTQPSTPQFPANVQLLSQTTPQYFVPANVQPVSQTTPQYIVPANVAQYVIPTIPPQAVINVPQPLQPAILQYQPILHTIPSSIAPTILQYQQSFPQSIPQYQPIIHTTVPISQTNPCSPIQQSISPSNPIMTQPFSTSPAEEKWMKNPSMEASSPSF